MQCVTDQRVLVLSKAQNEPKASGKLGGSPAKNGKDQLNSVSERCRAHISERCESGCRAVSVVVVACIQSSPLPWTGSELSSPGRTMPHAMPWRSDGALQESGDRGPGVARSVNASMNWRSVLVSALIAISLYSSNHGHRAGSRRTPRLSQRAPTRGCLCRPRGRLQLAFPMNA